jgi:hypothetical protein
MEDIVLSGVDGPSGDADVPGPAVNYHFPVQIEVVGALDEAAVHAVGEHVFRELTRELDSRL